jgi:hypothetical protein
MSNDFYDNILDNAGIIAHEYGISISDVMSLLVSAGRDEKRVKQALQQSAQSEEAKAAQKAGRQFDLVEHTRTLLQQK